MIEEQVIKNPSCMLLISLLIAWVTRMRSPKGENEEIPEPGCSKLARNAPIGLLFLDGSSSARGEIVCVF